jgi:predicted dehydrogenase
MTAPRKLRLAVIGAGAWGKNLVRAFASLPQVDLRLVVDRAPEARERAALAGFPTAEAPEAAFADPTIDAIAVATPAHTHAALTIAALGAEKHVFVEKPLCLALADGDPIRRAAAAAGRIVMVGHLMLYHPAMDKLRSLVRSGELGELHYLCSTRVNLGVARLRENAWWSLAPHDLSMILDLLGCEPLRIAAHGSCHLTPGIEDVVFAHLDFPGGVTAAIHVSWLDPRKVRELTVVGSRKMAVFNDMEPAEKIRIHDVAADAPADFNSYAELIALRRGDILTPRLAAVEPLQVELAHFLRCALEDSPPRTGIDSSLAIVRVLEAGQRSLQRGGVPVAVRE